MKKFFIRFFIVALYQSRQKLSTTEIFFFFPSFFNFLILVFLRHLRSDFLSSVKRVKNYGNYLSTQNACNIGNFPKLNHFLPALSAFLDALKFLFCKFHPFLWCGVPKHWSFCVRYFSHFKCIFCNLVCLFVLCCPLQPSNVISQLFGVSNSIGYWNTTTLWNINQQTHHNEVLLTFYLNSTFVFC